VHHVGFVGYSATKPGDRVLLAVDSHYDPDVTEAFAQALRDRGARRHPLSRCRSGSGVRLSRRDPGRHAA
jgi:hypothetical protein